MNKFMAIFGGAFSPVTNAHLSLAEQILNSYVHEVLFLPVGDSYYKNGLLHAHHRVAMLEEICKINPRFRVSDVEAKSTERLYTVDSLAILKEQYPLYDLVFVMGSDNLKELPTWKGYETMMNNYCFMVIARNGDKPSEIIEENPLLYKHKNNVIIAWETVRNDGNSSCVRDLLRAGKSIRYLVPDEVYFYIKNHNLFRMGV